MSIEKSSFFAIPSPFVSELEQLRKEWRHALSEQQYDIRVLMNQMYRRADDVATYRQTITQEDNISAVASVTSYLVTKAWDDRAYRILAPDDCPSFKRAIQALEAQFGGEDALLYQVTRRAIVEWSAEGYRPIYRAMREVLDRAVAERAGFAWLYHDDNAQADLEAARERERQRLTPDPAIIPLTPEERERRRAAIRAEVKEHEERMYELDRENERTCNPYVEKPENIVFYAVPAASMDEVRALHIEATTPTDYDADDYDERAENIKWGAPDNPISKLIHRAWDESEDDVTLAERGHQSALTILEHMLEEFAPTVVQAGGLYEPEQAQVLARTLDAWIAHMDSDSDDGGAIAAITAQAYGHSRTHTEQVIERLRRLLTHATRRGCGLVRVIDLKI